MNMPVKWHLAAHIACNIKHKKIGMLTSYEKKHSGMLKSCSKAGMQNSCAWTWKSGAKAGMLLSSASTWTGVHLFIFTIWRPSSRLKRANMPFKWNTPSHIRCKVKHNTICYMDISRRKKPGMLKSCAKSGMLISGAWTWNQVHINVHNYEAVYPSQMHEYGSQVT